MQEMRISQLVLDPTSHADSKNLKSSFFFFFMTNDKKGSQSQCVRTRDPAPTRTCRPS